MRAALLSSCDQHFQQQQVAMNDRFGGAAAGPSFGAIIAAHQCDLQTAGTSCSQADLLTHPILALGSDAARVEGSSALQSRIADCVQAHKGAQSDVEAHKKRFVDSVDALLSTTKARRDQLARLPDEIGSVEDALAELCNDLSVIETTGQEASTSAAASSSALVVTLASQQALLRQLESVRDYMSVLARAEELKDLACKAEDKGVGKGQDDSCVHLTELTGLSKRVSGLAKTEGEASMNKSSDLKATAFTHAQKAQAFAHLVKRREERLSAALTAAGWPPPPPELQVEGVVAQSKAKTPSDTLLSTPEVRRRWRELMMLQRTSEKLSILRPASARMRHGTLPADEEVDDIALVIATPSPSPAPGSGDFQPLLAVQCLLRPLLLRFYFHFDTARTTNRLDKPEWFLSHMLAVLRSNAALFEPVSGAVAELCNNVSRSRRELRYDLSAELLHGLLRPLSLKLESSIPLLLQNAQLLSHTIMQAVQFDHDIRSMLMPIAPTTLPIYLADALLSNESVFEAWVQSERKFANERLDQELESGGAWLVGDETTGIADDPTTDSTWTSMVQEDNRSGMEDVAGDPPSSASQIKSTRSARAVVDLVDGLTARYSALPSISHQLPFLLIQLSVLQAYAQRLERSLDAFESLSSAFSRAIPGAITGDSQASSNNGEQDMVRGLRGLGRLLKACLSAMYVSTHLSDLSSQSFFLVMGTSLSTSSEGSRLLSDFRKWETDEEERELDHASLGELVRRGWRSGGRLASGMRPLSAATEAAASAAKETAPKPPAKAGETIDVWAKSQARFDELTRRSLKAIEKMVTSEVLDGMRAYATRDWAEDDDDDEEDGVLDVPTPTLLPCLSVLSTHLHHLVPSLPRVQANRVYRSIAESLSTAIVDRTIFAGGAHRFTLRGARRFHQDVQQGWLGVVDDVVAALSRNAVIMTAGQSLATALGFRPHAPWRYLLDAASLLTLTDDDVDEADEAQNVTLQQACRAAFEPTMAGPSWQEVVQRLNIDDRLSLRAAREILRRRTECPW